MGSSISSSVAKEPSSPSSGQHQGQKGGIACEEELEVGRMGETATVHVCRDGVEDALRRLEGGLSLRIGSHEYVQLGEFLAEAAKEDAAADASVWSAQPPLAAAGVEARGLSVVVLRLAGGETPDEVVARLERALGLGPLEALDHSAHSVGVVLRLAASAAQPAEAVVARLRSLPPAFRFYVARPGSASRPASPELPPGGAHAAAHAAAAAPLLVGHFNDCYHVFATRRTEPVGGVARFATVLGEYAGPRTLVLASGDFLAPSHLSTITRGAHMVPVLNRLGTAACAVGNHDLDHGLVAAAKLFDQCDFPWLLSNLAFGADRLPLDSVVRYKVLERGGVRVGLLGLVDEEWLEAVPAIKYAGERVAYADYVECAREGARRLRRDHGCDLVFALTHMRNVSDLRLAREAGPDLDLVLGGHEHVYWVRHVEHDDAGGRTLVVKSGYDFRTFNAIEVYPHGSSGAAAVPEGTVPGADADEVVAARSAYRGQRATLVLHGREVLRETPKDPGMERLVRELGGEVEERLRATVGELAHPLDARWETLRTRESNAGNWVADLLRAHFDTDVALTDGGAIRGNTLFAAGPLSGAGLAAIFPFEDGTLAVSVTGAQLRAALEHGLSEAPLPSGKFPVVSGLRVEVDLALKPGARVTRVLVTSGGDGDDEGRELRDEEVLRMATTGFLRAGGDGYSMLAGLPTLPGADEEAGAVMGFVAGQYLSELRRANRMGPAVAPKHASELRLAFSLHPRAAVGDESAFPLRVDYPEAGGDRIVLKYM